MSWSVMGKPVERWDFLAELAKAQPPEGMSDLQMEQFVAAKKVAGDLFVSNCVGRDGKDLYNFTLSGHANYPHESFAGTSVYVSVYRVKRPEGMPNPTIEGRVI